MEVSEDDEMADEMINTTALFSWRTSERQLNSPISTKDSDRTALMETFSARMSN
jgi:hypothetical protein